MRRLLWLWVILVLGVATLLVGISQGRTAPQSDEGEHEAVVHYGTTACGVERWWVKTGIDASARTVNLRTVTSTTVFHLRSLPAPNFLPARSRIRPVETTVWKVSAILLRYKLEADSDVHLVIADKGGRTMIAEIPAPACVGSNSPFRSRIRTARSA